MTKQPARPAQRARGTRTAQTDAGRPATAAVGPREALFGSSEPFSSMPVVDHYAGVESRMRKSLALQGEMGPVFDVTLDAEDGAPVGGEVEHAHLIAELLASPGNRYGRVGARVLPLDHPKFDDVVDIVVHAARAPAYVMLPKPNGLADVKRAARAIDAAGGASIALHALIETHGALRDVFAIAAHPRIESLSFGLMDFVSAHRGAIPLVGMSAQGQFEHPLVVRAKVEIAAACHAAGKTPSHSVVAEFRHERVVQSAAERACRQFGYARMWSIHPDQIEPIIEGFAPSAAEVDRAIEILFAAQAVSWAPIRLDDTLYDRATYRYFWNAVDRAHRTGQPLPASVREAWFGEDPTA